MSLPNNFNRITRYPQSKLYVTRVRDALDRAAPILPTSNLVQSDTISLILLADAVNPLFKAGA